MSEEGFFVDYDAETGEVSTTEIGGDNDTTVAVIDDTELSLEEAQELTDAIRAAGVVLYAMIARAHRGKAYKVLGYDTFEEYVKQEFDMSRSRAYQLLDLSKTIEAIQSVVPEGTEFKLTEAQARDIKKQLPRITERIGEETDGLDADEAAEVVEKVVEEERAPKAPEFDVDIDHSNEASGDYRANTDYDNSTPYEKTGGDKSDNDAFDELDDWTPDNNVDAALTAATSPDDEDWPEDNGYTAPMTKPSVDDESLKIFLDFIENFSRFKTVRIFLDSLSKEQRRIVSDKALDVSDFFNDMLNELAIGEMNRV